MERQYKDSGIEWIGRIPEEWKICSIKNYCLSIYAGGTPQSNNPSYWDGDIPWIPSGSCQNRLIHSAPKFITQDGLENSSTKLIPKNTTVMAMTGATCSNVGYVTFETCMNQSVVAYIENKTKAFSKFLYYLLQGAQEEILTRQSGGAQSGINVEDCKNIKVPFLSLPEQQRIASYLDKKCGEIDELLALQEKMIAQLTEYKQAVITEAVTKGLDPNAKLVPSGIEWIGDVPEGWKVSRLKFFSRFINGFAFNSDVFTLDNGCKVIRIGDISHTLDFHGCVRANVEADALQAYRIMNNDIVIAMSGATTGKSCIAKDVEEAYINQRVGIIRCREFSFIYYQLQTDYFMEYINLNNAGSAQPNVSGSSIGNFPILVPPLSEQQRIASYLDTKCSEIDSLIALKRQKIESLNAYKKSVIYETVTGKTII